MPPTHTDEGLRAAEAIRAEHGTAVGILVLSQYVETTFALRLVADGAGGVGYLLKDRVDDLDDFADAIRRIAKGGSVIDPEVVAQLVGRRRAKVPLDDLTEREREVLALMAEGRSNQAICDRLFLAPKTVEAHIANIFSKLELLPRPTITAACSPCWPTSAADAPAGDAGRVRPDLGSRVRPDGGRRRSRQCSGQVEPMTAGLGTGQGAQT